MRDATSPSSARAVIAAALLQPDGADGRELLDALGVEKVPYGELD